MLIEFETKKVQRPSPSYSGLTYLQRNKLPINLENLFILPREPPVVLFGLMSFPLLHKELLLPVPASNWSWILGCCVASSGLTSEPTHLHHPAHTQLAQDPLTGHTLVISTLPVAHTTQIGKCQILDNPEARNTLTQTRIQPDKRRASDTRAGNIEETLMYIYLLGCNLTKVGARCVSINSVEHE